MHLEKKGFFAVLGASLDYHLLIDYTYAMLSNRT